MKQLGEMNRQKLVTKLNRLDAETSPYFVEELGVHILMTVSFV
jgi:hypothetical protein